MRDAAINDLALLPLEGGINFRDMGGYRTEDGRLVRRGVLFRSGGLWNLTESDLVVLKDLSIKTILDYRDVNEAAQSPDRLWEGAKLVSVPAIIKETNLSADPKKLVENLIREKTNPEENAAVKMMGQLYAELPFGNPAYRTSSRRRASNTCSSRTPTTWGPARRARSPSTSRTREPRSWSKWRCAPRPTARAVTSCETRIPAVWCCAR